MQSFHLDATIIYMVEQLKPEYEYVVCVSRNLIIFHFMCICKGENLWEGKYFCHKFCQFMLIWGSQKLLNNLLLKKSFV